MVVRLPEQALDTTGTDILPPLKELQQGLGVLPTDADRAKSGAGATFVGPPEQRRHHRSRRDGLFEVVVSSYRRFGRYRSCNLTGYEILERAAGRSPRRLDSRSGCHSSRNHYRRKRYGRRRRQRASPGHGRAICGAGEYSRSIPATIPAGEPSSTTSPGPSKPGHPSPSPGPGPSEPSHTSPGPSKRGTSQKRSHLSCGKRCKGAGPTQAIKSVSSSSRVAPTRRWCNTGSSYTGGRWPN